MKRCNSCYHFIEISDTEERFFICGLHNLECTENGSARGGRHGIVLQVHLQLGLRLSGILVFQAAIRGVTPVS